MNAISLISSKSIGGFLFVAIALVFVYFVPTLSHLLNFPLYLIEPMRIVLVLALVHTSRVNAFVLAVTLPLFSFLVSGHPVFYKMILISAELLVNVGLFYLTFSKTRNAFISILISIAASKALYYLAKFIISVVIIKSGESLIATPIYIQLATTLVFALYAGFVFKKRD
jgi:hypothetical protein